MAVELTTDGEGRVADVSPLGSVTEPQADCLEKRLARVCFLGHRNERFVIDCAAYCD